MTRVPNLAVTGLIASLISCYGVVALVALLSLVGIAVRIDNRIWDAVSVGCGVLALVGLARNRRAHRRIGPIVLGTVGFALIAWVMFGDYNDAVEAIGFGVLVVATIWDVRHCRSGSVGARPSW
ncbi:MerC family mercury resistance protein [Acidiphilium acidophilum]|uniref:MerC family mercury resistance protein n=1 Tax=Acidiphilium acidophilum TaxID=76588 RepID=UPI002E8E6833|nr:MerC family mercury resistance protein [Acidiphilium acidophilum]